MNQITKYIGIIRFSLLDLLGGITISKALSELTKQQFFSKETLQKIQDEKFHNLFHIAQSSTVFYKNTTSYSELPVLTKEMVRAQFDNFISNTYKKKLYTKATGGSTGKSLVYYSTALSRSYLWAGIILSWMVAGYVKGDKIAIIAGSALIDIKSSFKRKIFYKLLNVETYSAYKLEEQSMSDYIDKIIVSKVKIIYGYATVLDRLATFINTKHPASFPNLKGIVSTAEILTEQMRQNIQAAFNADVFNQYGCNEAGVSAFECEYHHLHLINTRSYFEVDNEGSLISTDLSNEGFIMIKYLTGDKVEMSEEMNCKCGRHFPIIKKVVGRVNDFIVDMSQHIVHGSFFHFLFRNDNSIKQFQVQFDHNSINIFLNVNLSMHEKLYYNRYLDEVKRNLNFNEYNLFINSTFLTSTNAKHRHIINTSEPII
jgi:phenylacetate-CoA ligase